MWDKNSFFLVFLIVLAFITQVWLGQSKWVESKDYLVPPPQQIERLAFGFSALIADSLWIRWIQNDDTCQTYGEIQQRPVPPSESANNFLKNPRHKICDFSWSYQMLDAVTRLQPLYKIAYTSGLMILVIMVEDYKGATILYNRALKEFPDDWIINYQAAFHFLGDDEDIPRAAQLLVHASEHGGMDWFRSLAARLYTRSGQLDLGISTLESYLKTLTDDGERKKVEGRIKDLRAKAAQSDKEP